MGEFKWTATSVFIVPTLKISEKNLSDHNFINAYIKDLRRDEQYEDAAYLLFKPGNLEVFQDFVDGEYDRTTSIVEDYDYEGGYVVLVYTLNPDFKRDFELVKQGKYSKTSEEFQDLFPKLKQVIRKGIVETETYLQHKVFNKSEELKHYWYKRIGRFDDDWEVWDGFDIEKETLDIEKIKELV